MSSFGFRGRRGIGLRWKGGILLLTLGTATWLLGHNPAPAAAGILPTPPPLPTLPTPTLTPLPTPPVPVPPVLPPPAVPGVPGVPGAPNPAGGVVPAGGISSQAPPPGAAPAGSVQAAAAPAAVVPPAGSIGAFLGALDPGLAAQLSSVLTSPEVLQPPSLKHFSFVVKGSPDQTGDSHLAGASAAGRGLEIGLIVLLVAVAAGIAVLMSVRRWRMRVIARLRRQRWNLRRHVGRLLPAPALAVAMLIAAAVGTTPLVHGTPDSARTWAPQATPAPSQATAPAAVARGELAAVNVQSGNQGGQGGAASPSQVQPGRLDSHPAQPVVLTTLQRIEQQVQTTRDRVLADQSTIHTLAVSPAAPPAQSPATDPRPRALPPDARLKLALADNQTAQGIYQQALKDEYAYFATVANDPQSRAALLAAIQQLNNPAATQAVLYDLQVIDTFQAQEAAIRTAEANQPLTAPAVVAGPGGGLTTPLGGSVTQPFGPTSFSLEPPMTYSGVFYPHFHTGTDIATTRDTPVVAAANGVVILAGQSVNGAGQLVGYGNYVVIQHADGYRTLYGHLDQLMVRAGQPVTAGQPIGLEGSTGWSTGPHLHFEVRRGNVPVDPMPYLQGQAPI